MSKKSIASLVVVAIVFFVCAIALNILAASYGFVSDLSPVLFATDLDLHETGNSVSSETTALCGLVIHANGDGVRNARVHLRGEGYEGQAFKYTERDGRFVFEEVPVFGRYRLTVRANGLVFSKTSVTVDGAGCDDVATFVADPLY